MKKLYIDIDGVLLQKGKERVVEYAEEFIDFITKYFDCYWLTTHCRHHNAEPVLKYLTEYYPSELIHKLRCIKPTDWSTLKTDAIDFGEEFYWLDDYPFQAELNVLKRYNMEDRCIIVDLSRKGELKQLKDKLSLYV